MVRRNEAALPPRDPQAPGDRHARDNAATLAGVDEAGLGPVLGPLVVAGVALSGPRGEDPWRLLRSVVCRRQSRKGKIRVADSKKVNQGPHGRQHLERAVLSFWGTLHGKAPATLAELLQQAGVPLEPLRRCPWYATGIDLPLPLDNDRGELELKSHLLGRAMEAKQIHLLHIALRPVDAAEFNALIAATDNKSHAHFQAYSAVIAELLRVLQDTSRDDAHLVADRCGGRFRYLAGLRQHLPGRRIQVLEEHPEFSSYLVHGGRGTGGVRSSFAARGEDRAFPTALASCAAKYVRELMMECLNRWFACRVPGLRRTAGYYVDGHRFLQEVESVTASQGFPMEWLRRVR